MEILIQTQPAEYLGYAAVNQVIVAAPEYIWRYKDWIRHYPEEWFWFWWRNLFDWFKDILSPEYQIASLLLKKRLDSINIFIWKQFKRTINSSDVYKLQIWKNFAIYLLQAGLD